MPRNALAKLIDGFSRPTREALRRYAPFAALGRVGHPADSVQSRLQMLCDALLSGRGEASGVAIATDILRLYRSGSAADKASFFAMLAERFGPDPGALGLACERYRRDGAPALAALTRAVEAPRQEVFRRLNMAPGGTTALVRMRGDLLDLLKTGDAALRAVDADFVHILQSWFNRGFLSMRAIDWSSPASLLERVIAYEAVHDISNFAELRRRLDPTDRRCFGFFHPAMPAEPLIFVEVSLGLGIPDSIAEILRPERETIPAEAADTAVFYSINNCQPGLRGISFGHFLIKQVAADLKRELPGLKTFVTLSPVPGFMAYLDTVAREPADTRMVEALRHGTVPADDLDQARQFVMAHAVAYFTTARTAAGQPLDPVARFHLGNGSRLERLNWPADLSPNGLRQSGGLMVNYLYDLARIEEYHEAYAGGAIVATGDPFRKVARSVTTETSATARGR